MHAEKGYVPQLCTLSCYPSYCNNYSLFSGNAPLLRSLQDAVGGITSSNAWLPDCLPAHRAGGVYWAMLASMLSLMTSSTLRSHSGSPKGLILNVLYNRANSGAQGLFKAGQDLQILSTILMVSTKAPDKSVSFGTQMLSSEHWS